MSKYPNELDTDIDLPRVNDNITDLGEEAINALREAVFNIEETLGLIPNGSMTNLSDRLNVSIEANGAIKSSAISSLGLVTLPIFDSEISATAAIKESKLLLTYSTQTLYNFCAGNESAIKTINSWLTLTGVKLNPHILGDAYNHELDAINVPASPSYTKRDGTARNTTNANLLVHEISQELSSHQTANGLGGATIPLTNYAHVAAGIEVDTSAFTIIPQTNISLQSTLEFLDGSNLFTVGERFQNLFSNGIPRTSRLSTLNADGYGANIVPVTNATTYLNYAYINIPNDDILNGDDVIELTPSDTVKNNNTFDAWFSQVKPNDVITVNYGTIQVQFIVEETKHITTSTKRYFVRINGKNLVNTTSASVRIDRALFNTNKYGVLSVAASNNSFSEYGSLIISNPRGAMALGLGFDPSKFDSTHYNLYLQLYPDGNPANKTINLPAIDVTGDGGVSPGGYSLQKIIDTINSKVRAAGYNYRFVAFSYNGEIGIMLADSYENASFAIIGGVVSSSGTWDVSSSSTYPNNVIDNVNGIDPLGFGANQANVAGAAYSSSYATVAQALLPVKIWVPLKRNYFYVNGVERDRFAETPLTSNDDYGDGYWLGTITNRVITGSTVETTYTIAQNLSTAKLQNGKTLVVLPTVAVTSGSYNFVDYGRFLIKSVVFNDCAGPNPTTTITVWDAVHGTGTSPYASSTNISVKLYFGEDSVGFNKENLSDTTSLNPFKRFHEVHIDQNGSTFTHERARFYLTPPGVASQLVTDNVNIALVNIVNVSEKLRGYKFTNSLTKLTLHVNDYDSSNGLWDGYLCKYDGSAYSHVGNTVSGWKGDVVKLYDDTNIDFIEVRFDLPDSVASFTNSNLDIQLFEPIWREGSTMRLASCLVNDSTKQVSIVNDHREFGNISPKDFTTSALSYIGAGEEYLHKNGVIRGFDYVSTLSDNQIYLKGGVALVGGAFISINNDFVEVPKVRELYSSTEYNKINWALCATADSELRFIPLRDYDVLNSTPSTENRVVTLLNPVTSGTYSVDSTTFNELSLHRKDLTLLYVVTSNVTGTGGSTAISVTIQDARRWANDSDSACELVITGDTSSGNFRTLEEALVWLRFNSQYGTRVRVRGNLTLSSSYTFDFSKLVTFEGDGNSTITVSSQQILTNNVKWKDINFALTTNNAFAISNAENIFFENCKFTCGTQVIRGMTLLNVKNFHFEKNYIDWKYIATVSSADIVVTGQGWIYGSSASSSSTINRAWIKENYFYYNPSSSGADHYPWINFELNGTGSLVEHLFVQSNSFTNAYTSSGVSDFRPALAIINKTSSSGVADYNVRPTLSNSTISGNNCDNRQSFIITSLLESGIMKMPGLAAVRVDVNSNTCGAIGYFTARNVMDVSPVVSTVSVNGFGLLNITHNVANLIYTCDSTGMYFDGGLKTAYAGSYAIGNVNITNNNANWIHTSVCSVLYDSLNIDNNALNAFDSTILSTYTDGYNTAILVAADLSAFGGDQASCKITNNNINQNIVKDGATSTATYQYDTGIDALTSATIKANWIKGLAASGTGINFGGKSTTIQDNQIYRNGVSITAYINFSHPDGSPSDPKAIVVENYFDDYTIDGTNEEVCTSLAVNFTYERNINQTRVQFIDWAAFDGYMDSTSSGSLADRTIYKATGYSVVKTSSLGGTYITLTDTANTQRRVAKMHDLSAIIPRNTKIIDGYIGYNALSSTSADYDLSSVNENKFSFRISKGAGLGAYAGSPYAMPPTPLTGNIMDVKNTSDVSSSSSATTSIASPIATYYNNTNYLYVEPTDTYIDGQRPVILDLQILFKGTNAQWCLSPIRIKYRW